MQCPVLNYCSKNIEPDDEVWGILDRATPMQSNIQRPGRGGHEDREEAFRAKKS